jgi:phosphohistidine phosphatase
MKSLLLLRHAKSSWKDIQLADHERPLKGRGRRAAALIGRYMAQNKLRPDVVLSSTATRARETVEITLKSARFKVNVRYIDHLYMATPETWINAVMHLESGKRQVLLVGHNPGLEDLLFRLTSIRETMPTACLAQIVFEIKKWSEVAAKNDWRLETLVRPRELLNE